MQLARHEMGAPADADAPEARRAGAPTEAFRFSAVGAAVAFLSEALRDLHSREPRATVALLSRHPEQADVYFEGLRRAEVPSLRRQDRAEDIGTLDRQLFVLRACLRLMWLRMPSFISWRVRTGGLSGNNT